MPADDRPDCDLEPAVAIELPPQHAARLGRALGRFSVNMRAVYVRSVFAFGGVVVGLIVASMSWFIPDEELSHRVLNIGSVVFLAGLAMLFFFGWSELRALGRSLFVNRGLTVIVCENGLLCTRRGQDELCPWEEIEAVAGEGRLLVVRRRDGWRLVLDEYLNGIDTVRQRIQEGLRRSPVRAGSVSEGDTASPR